MMKFYTLIIFLFLVNPFSYASSLKVMPTRIELNNHNKIATLTLSNESNHPVLIQTELFHWTNENEKDLYTLSSHLVVLPPSFSIKAGGRQQIRIALNENLLGQSAYRLYLTEIPIPENTEISSGLKVALRLGIPIFVELN